MYIYLIYIYISKCVVNINCLWTDYDVKGMFGMHRSLMIEGFKAGKFIWVGNRL
jgi:hypothetical protein